MIDERCELSELPADQCACRIHKPGGGMADVKPAVERTSGGYGPVFAARYRGRCGECHEDIEPGHPIRVMSVGSAYAHEECTE